MATGVRATLNFAPVNLQVGSDIRVASVDLAIHLEPLSFQLAGGGSSGDRPGSRFSRSLMLGALPAGCDFARSTPLENIANVGRVDPWGLPSIGERKRLGEAPGIPPADVRILLGKNGDSGPKCAMREVGFGHVDQTVSDRESHEAGNVVHV